MFDFGVVVFRLDVITPKLNKYIQNWQKEANVMVGNTGLVDKRGSDCEMLNKIISEIKATNDIYEVGEQAVLKMSADLNLGLNETDFPPRENPALLDPNQMHLLQLYFEDKDAKTGCQRTFDTFHLATSPKSFTANRRAGRNVFVSNRNNGIGSLPNRYKPGLRWVKFGIYKASDIEGSDDYVKSIKKNAGPELLTFINCYPNSLSCLWLNLGSIMIEGYNYSFSEKAVDSNFAAFIERDYDKGGFMSTTPIINFREREENLICHFLVDDLI